MLKFSEEETDHILRRKREGASFERIGREITRSPKRIANYYFQLTGGVRMPRWSERERMLLEEALRLGMSMTQAAEHVGTRSPNACSTQAIRIGKSFRDSHTPKRQYDPLAGVNAEYLAYREMCERGSAALLRAMISYYDRRVA